MMYMLDTNLMESLTLTAKQAMDLLKINPAEQ